MICGEARTGEEVLRDLPDSKAQLMVIDQAFPDTSGWDLIKEIQTWPMSLDFMIFSNDDSQSSIHTALNLGVKGYVLKHEPVANISLAVKSVIQSGCWFSSPIYFKIAQDRNRQNNPYNFDCREMKTIICIS